MSPNSKPESEVPLASAGDPATTTNPESTKALGSEVKENYYDCNMDRPFNMDKRLVAYCWYTFSHVLGLHGYWMMLTGSLPWLSLPLVLFHGYFGQQFGVSIGVHRLWAHKTFKAKLPLQIFLMYAQTASGQFSIFQWCRDHRLHHKFSDTDADPYTTKKGFFFSHMGWLLREEDPACKKAEQTLPLDDLNNDPVVRFQAKYYWPLFFIAVFVVPIASFVYLIPELTWYQIMCLNMAFILIPMHLTFSINSIAHWWGYRPYDKHIQPTDVPILGYLLVGEGYHNYHHAFPWDYSSHELGFFGFGFNFSRAFIELFAFLGLAYDLKTVPRELIINRMKRTGVPELGDIHSSFHPEPKENKPPPAWGWGDADISQEDKDITKRINPSKNEKDD